MTRDTAGPAPDKTIVFQSFRTTDVPAWVEACMASTRAWAASRGFTYRFYDDAFFDFCPAWYRDRVRGNVLLTSDLARLMAARELHATGFDRAIWVDADVLVFAPDAFRVHAGDADQPYAFCDELWVNAEGGKFVGRRKVNNAVCAFDCDYVTRRNHFLDFYIDACQAIVRRRTDAPPERLGVGTAFLSELHRLLPLPLIECVGTFNPILLDHLARDDDQPLHAYRKAFGRPIAAANLCGSFRNAICQGVRMTDELYGRAVERLSREAGKSVAT